MLGFTRHVPAHWFAPLQLGLDRGRQHAADSLIKQNAPRVEAFQEALDRATAVTPELDASVSEFLTALRDKSVNPFTSRPAMWLDKRVRGRRKASATPSRLQHSLNHHFNHLAGNYDLWAEAVLAATRGHAHARIRHLSDDGLRAHMQRLAPQHTYVLQPPGDWPYASRSPRPDLVVMTPELHGRTPALTVRVLRECLREAPLGILVIDALRAFP